MARVPDIKRLQKDDFEDEYQDLISVIAFSLNSFMDQVVSALNKNLDFNNLNQEIINIDLSVDINGTPIIETKYKSNLKTKVIGHHCINAIDQTDPNGLTTGTPFLKWTQNNKIVTVLNVKGLEPNTKYTISVLSIGASS